jgi:hypothetical protein
MDTKNPHIGSSLDDFLKAEGMLAEARASALDKRTNPVVQSTEKQRAWKWWKRVAITMGVVGLAGFCWSSSLWYQYQRTLPRQPDVGAGRIYPLNVHGIVVYQTHDERSWLDEVEYSSIAVFVAGGLMGTFYQRKFGRDPIPPTIGPSWTSRR